MGRKLDFNLLPVLAVQYSSVFNRFMYKYTELAIPPWCSLIPRKSSKSHKRGEITTNWKLYEIRYTHKGSDVVGTFVDSKISATPTQLQLQTKPAHN